MSRPHETVERAREARLVQDEHVESPMVGSVFHNVLNFVRQLQNVVDNQDVVGLEHRIEIFKLFQRERDHLNAGQFALGPWSLYAKVAVVGVDVQNSPNAGRILEKVLAVSNDLREKECLSRVAAAAANVDAATGKRSVRQQASGRRRLRRNFRIVVVVVVAGIGRGRQIGCRVLSIGFLLERGGA